MESRDLRLRIGLGRGRLVTREAEIADMLRRARIAEIERLRRAA